MKTETLNLTIKDNWQVIEFKNGKNTIYKVATQDHDLICDAYGWNAENNAKIICHAVNNYDSLLSALKKLAEWKDVDCSKEGITYDEYYIELNTRFIYAKVAIKATEQ